MTLVLRMMPPAIRANSPIGQGAGVNQLWDGNLRFRARMRNPFLPNQKMKNLFHDVLLLRASLISMGAIILCKSMRSPLGSGSVSGTDTTFPTEIEKPEKLGCDRFMSDGRP
nr:hypothetical protein [Brucella abortus]